MRWGAATVVDERSGATDLTGEAPAAFDVETLAGSVQPIRRPEDFEELSRVAKEEHVEKVVRELRAE